MAKDKNIQQRKTREMLRSARNDEDKERRERNRQVQRRFKQRWLDKEE